MKTIKIVLAIALSLGFLLFLGTCATTKTPLPTDNIDELLGTWVNPEYEGRHTGNRKAKYIYMEDGTATCYEYLEGGSVAFVIYLDVKEKWVDRKGAVYFIYHYDVPLLTGSDWLTKISPDRKTMEGLVTTRIDLLPSEMDPDAPYCEYYIWHRQ